MTAEKRNKLEENVPILKNYCSESSHRIHHRYVITFMCFLACTITYAMRMNMSIAIIPMAQDFNWSSETQQNILGSFYYGYFISPIFGGWLCERCGGSAVVQISVLLSSLMMLLTKFAAEFNQSLFIVTRIIDGIGQGLTLPSSFKILSKWSKIDERSTLTSITLAGLSAGPILSSYVSAWLCSSNFFGGWPSTFYILCLCGVLWTIFWYIFGSSEPYNNRWVSTFELNFMALSEEQDLNIENENCVPWKEIIVSMPVWAIVITMTCFNCGYLLLFADIPIFFDTILGFNLKATGILSIMPHCIGLVTTIVGGVLADYLISKNLLNVGNTRKLLAIFDLAIPAVCLVIIGYSTDKTLSVVLMTTAFGLYGFHVSAVETNVMDVAPNHSGLIMGLVLTIACSTGFIMPSLVGAFIKTNNTIYQWRKIYWIIASIHIFGLAFFFIFGSGEAQEWSNRKKNDEHLSETAINAE